MKKSILNISHKLLVGVVALGAVLWIFVSIDEVYNARNNSDVYIKVNHISDHAEHWQFKSLKNFIIWNYLHALLGAFFLTIALLSLKYKKLIVVLNLLLSLLLIWIIRYYILWVKSGYDHYPGFDPYLF